jgi:hypothetical protein
MEKYERCKKFLSENLSERENVRDMVTDGKIKLKCFLKVGHDNADWIHVAQNRHKWRGGACEQGDEFSALIKDRKYTDLVSDQQPL